MPRCEIGFQGKGGTALLCPQNESFAKMLSNEIVCGKFLLRCRLLKSKDNQLASPDCGCQVDLMTASGTSMAPYGQNLWKITSSGIWYLTLLCPYGKKYYLVTRVWLNSEGFSVINIK